MFNILIDIHKYFMTISHSLFSSILYTILTYGNIHILIRNIANSWGKCSLVDTGHTGLPVGNDDGVETFDEYGVSLAAEEFNDSVDDDDETAQDDAADDIACSELVAEPYDEDTFENIPDDGDVDSCNVKELLACLSGGVHE